MKTDTTTPTQKKALHLYFRHLATALNDAGYTVPIVLKESIDIDWNEVLVKELIWRGVQRKKIEKESTIHITKEEMDCIFEEINRYFGQKFGVHVPFPSEENRYLEKYEN